MDPIGTISGMLAIYDCKFNQIPRHRRRGELSRLRADHASRRVSPNRTFDVGDRRDEKMFRYRSFMRRHAVVRRTVLAKD
jgi:hypothetical protein